VRVQDAVEASTLLLQEQHAAAVHVAAAGSLVDRVLSEGMPPPPSWLTALTTAWPHAWARAGGGPREAEKTEAHAHADDHDVHAVLWRLRLVRMQAAGGAMAAGAATIAAAPLPTAEAAAAWTRTDPDHGWLAAPAYVRPTQQAAGHTRNLPDMCACVRE
jgi:hypothetical protein